MLDGLPPPPPHLAALTGKRQDVAEVSHALFVAYASQLLLNV